MSEIKVVRDKTHIEQEILRACHAELDTKAK